MKPAATRQSPATRDKTLRTAFTRGASAIALCVAALVGHANAKNLPNSVLLNLHTNRVNQNLESNKNFSGERFTSILRDIQNPGTMVSQANALSWPPQFAIGQTWTINTVGVGNWVLPLTTTVAGDATGYTTGTDKREGWFRYYPKDGLNAEVLINYLQGDNETYLCGFFSTGNPNGNTLNGSAFRVKKGGNQPDDLKTTCSATLGGNSSTTPQSPFATTPNVPLNPNANTAQGSSPVWPPKPGEAWTMTIDGLAPWAINFEKLDKDGDPTGSALQSGVKSTAFAYLDSGEYIFEVTDGKTVYECVFTKLQVQGNAYVGGQAYSGAANSNSLPKMDKSCSAALGAAQGGTQTQGATQAQNLSWPPQLAVGQKWDYRYGTRPAVYHGNFATLTNNIYKGDLITEGTGDPIAKRALSVVYSAKDDALISFAQDPQGGITGCLFAGQASIKSATYVGATLYQAPGAKDFVDQNLECRMSAVTSTTNPAVAGNQSPTWPPKPNEAWTMSIDGLAPWAINFEKLDSDGDPTGTAMQNGTAFTAFAFKDTGVAGIFQMANRQTGESFYCAFKTLEVKGNAFVGGVALNQPKGGQAAPMNKSCLAALGSSVNTNASTTTNTAGSTLGGIFGNTTTTTTNTSTGLSWPVQVAPGQAWSVSVKNIAFQLKLERVNNGITIGTATSSAGELAGGFVTQGDNLNLILTDGTATITCTFSRSSIQGQTLSGQATYSEKPNAPEQSWGACSATLGPKVSSNADPLSFLPKNPLLLEPQIGMLRHFSSW
jgi:hypothetical protein